MQASENGGRSTTHVALVDDDPSVRQALRRLLLSTGFAVEAFAKGEDLLKSELLEEQQCLILDVHMPGLNGLDIQKIIRNMPHPLPIIFITAHGDDAIKVQAFENGAVGFLEKPFDDKALLGLIQKAIKNAA